jgi:hypothetical protein
MASAKIGLPSEKVFGDSYSYWEKRVSKKFVCDKFMDYAYQEKIPETVRNYCIDILANRVTQQPQLTRR